ncbi:MAG: TIM barrel protein [Armatimonadia bacterium]|nr:TIM barrel protein [Armatimonadia bacterium]
MSTLLDKMHVGLVHPMAFPDTIKGEGPVLETIETIATDTFFGAIEIRPTISDDMRAKVASVVSQTGIVAIISGQPPLLIDKLDINALDESARTKAVECVKASVDEAAAVGAPYAAILTGPDPGEADREKAVDQLVKSLGEACAYAKQVSTTETPIHISLEAFDRDVDKKCLVGPTPLAVKVMERVKSEGHENVGLLIDLSHLPLLQESARQCLTAAAPHLIHIHAGNAFVRDREDPAYGDQHPRFGYPGSMNDVDDLTEFIRVLVDVGYFKKQLPTGKPVFTFEVKPVPGESSELIIAGTKRILREALDRVG